MKTKEKTISSDQAIFSLNEKKVEGNSFEATNQNEIK